MLKSSFKASIVSFFRKKTVYLRKKISRQSIILSLDTIIAVFCFPVALFLRVGKDLFNYSLVSLTVHIGLFTLVACGWYLISHSYTRMWRTLSFRDITAYKKLCFYTLLTYLPIFFTVSNVYPMPRSMPVLVFFIQLFSLVAIRYIYYTWHIMRSDNRGTETSARENSLIIGTGQGLEEVLHQQQAPQLHSFNIKGIIHKNKNFTGRSMYGVPVLGNYRELKQILKKSRERKDYFKNILLADADSFTAEDFKNLLEMACEYNISFQKLSPQNKLNDNIVVEKISVEDLLGRDEVDLDLKPVETCFKGETVLVTGAGGSIGSELVRQVSQLYPRKIILLDSSEYNLYKIDLEQREKHPQLEIVTVLADVTMEKRVEQIFRRYKPTIVCHAAALKHVPMVENNPLEGIRTNVMGTRIIADSCYKYGVKSMVMISTDKAINPSNIMGASKRLAEMYCQSLDIMSSEQKKATQFITVRFGNVLGSTGSVVPLFQEQIKKGGPITLTHPNMLRYFMTIKEAVSLVLQASSLESSDRVSQGSIFVLDMGQPLRISDLARQMILLAGKKPGEEVRIRYTGIRPGEKLYEELFHKKEKMEGTSCPKIFKAYPRFTDYQLLSKHLDEVVEACLEQDEKKTLALLNFLVPEYQKYIVN